MKYILNIIWAFLLSWLHRSVVREYALSETAQTLTYWIFDIPLEVQVALIWCGFSFPRHVGHALGLLGNGIFQTASYGVQSTGKLAEQVWKTRAGQILIGAGVAYLAYIFIF